MADENFIHCWYENGHTKDMNCKKWLQKILLKKHELDKQKGMEDSLYNSTEGSFSFHINGEKSMLPCDMQSKNLLPNSNLALPELYNKRSSAMPYQNINDDLKWNCALEISGSKFFSNFKQTSKKMAQFTLQEQTELKTKTQSEKCSFSENFTKCRNQKVPAKIPEKNILLESKGENISLANLDFNQQSIMKNVNSNLAILNHHKSSNLTTGSGICSNLSSGNVKDENSVREILINSKLTLSSGKSCAKKFIYPNEINEKLQSIKFNENKSSRSSLSFDDQSISEHELKRRRLSAFEKANTIHNQSIQSPVISLKKDNIKPKDSSDRCPLFKTALGNKITVSDSSLRTVKKLWDECDSNDTDVSKCKDKLLKQQNNSTKTGISPASSNNLIVKTKIQCEIVNGLKSTCSLNTQIKPSCNQKTSPIFRGFQTASNKQIKIDPLMLTNARKILEDDDDDNKKQLELLDGKNFKFEAAGRPSFRSKSPILNSQICQTFSSDSKLNCNRYGIQNVLTINYKENVAHNGNNKIDNINTSLEIGKEENKKCNPTTETQDIRSITEDFLLFSSCNSEKNKYKRQWEENSTHIIKKTKG